MKIALAMRDVRDAEAELGDELGRIGERHRADHDVFHISRTLIGLHHANLEALTPFGERYGTSIDPAGMRSRRPATSSVSCPSVTRRAGAAPASSRPARATRAAPPTARTR